MPRCVGAKAASLRAAFSSCRSHPLRLPRPAWYHATATCTRPWKKSRSSAAAARHSSSSSSCAAKNSPERMSSTPLRKCDLDVPVLHADLVRPEADRVVEVVEAGAHVVRPPVPGTPEQVILDAALAERALQVEAGAGGGVEVVAHPHEGELHVARLHASGGSRRHLVRSGDRDEHGLD